MRTGELAFERIAVGSIRAFAGAGYSGNDARAQVDFADHVILAIGDEHCPSIVGDA